MKKLLLTFCILCSLSLTFASCSMKDVKNNVEEGVEKTEGQAKAVKQNAESIAEKPVEAIEEFTSNENNNVDRTNFITQEMAKQNAIKRAGVDGNSVKFIKVDFDKDEGRYLYEIEFVSGNKEYEIEISANDGSVISYDEDIAD